MLTRRTLLTRLGMVGGIGVTVQAMQVLGLNGAATRAGDAAAATQSLAAVSMSSSSVPASAVSLPPMSLNKQAFSSRSSKPATASAAEHGRSATATRSR